MPIALNIEKLSCVRAHRMVFRDLSLSLTGGGILAVEGANGAGKTSLLRMIAGFLHPASGSISFHTSGQVVTDPEERGVFSGWLGHHDAVKPQMGVREQLAFWARLYAAGGSVEEAMAAFGLEKLKDIPGQYLSAGQRRRLALARLQLLRRPLWLLDEPFAALDTAGKTLVVQAILSHCASGGIVIAATHEPLGVACETLTLGRLT